jgi:hypothetical protein
MSIVRNSLLAALCMAGIVAAAPAFADMENSRPI